MCSDFYKIAVIATDAPGIIFTLKAKEYLALDSGATVLSNAEYQVVCMIPTPSSYNYIAMIKRLNLCKLINVS